MRLCASWWVGEWQKCTASCGSSGQTKRTVLCIQAVSAEEQKALQPKDCEHVAKPESVLSCNTHIPCPANWTAGGWSKVSPEGLCTSFFAIVLAVVQNFLKDAVLELNAKKKKSAIHFNISWNLCEERQQIDSAPAVRHECMTRRQQP